MALKESRQKQAEPSSRGKKSRKPGELKEHRLVDYYSSTSVYINTNSLDFEPIMNKKIVNLSLPNGVLVNDNKYLRKFYEIDAAENCPNHLGTS